MAAWGLFEKRDVRNLSRVASARTLDGFKIRAKLALHFPRAVTMAEADATMMEYARAFANAVESELCSGTLPFEDRELEDRLARRVDTLPRRNVRVIGLHVWHKGAISSRSMQAVDPAQVSSPTVPNMAAVARPTSSRAPDPIHSRATVRPPDEVGRAMPPGSAAASKPPAAPSSGLASEAPSARPSRTRISGAQSARASLKAPSSPGMPAPSISRAGSALVSDGVHVPSGVVPAVEPRIVRSRSGFLVALESCTEGTGVKVGRALAQPVRDAAALVLLGALEASHEQLSDPLLMLEGQSDPTVQRQLIGEACVCVSYLLYEALCRTSLPQMRSIEVVQGACTAALGDDSMPVSEISRYLATENPRDELTNKICTLLEIRETPSLQRRIDATLHTLRLDVRASAGGIEAKLADGSAKKVG